MSFYRVMNTFVDNVNGYHIKNGQYVKTTDKEWAQRFGSLLKEEQTAPNNVDIIMIENTLETQNAQALKLQQDLEIGDVTEDIATDLQLKKGLTRKTVPNKAIMGDEDSTENK